MHKYTHTLHDKTPLEQEPIEIIHGLNINILVHACSGKVQDSVYLVKLQVQSWSWKNQLWFVKEPILSLLG